MTDFPKTSKKFVTDDPDAFALEAPAAPAWSGQPPQTLAELRRAKAGKRAETQRRLRLKRSRAMILRHGTGPDGMTCRPCQHFERHMHGVRVYAKCRLYGVSSSGATDWSGRWPACSQFTPRPPQQEP